MFFVLVAVLFVIYVIMFWRSINTHTGDYGLPTAAILRAAHNVLYAKKHTNERFISCDGHQLYAFKGLGVDLKVEGVHYVEMHCGLVGPYVLVSLHNCLHVYWGLGHETTRARSASASFKGCRARAEISN